MHLRNTLFCGLIIFFLSFASPPNLIISDSSAELETVLYYSLIKDSFSLTNAEIDSLKENKFVVLNRMGTEDLLDAYKYYWVEDLPIFITTDTMLHTWHLIFDHSLEDIEQDFYYPLFSELLAAMLSKALAGHEENIISDSSLIYIAVAATLINSTHNATLPSNIKNNVSFIVDNILQAISLPEAITKFNTVILKRYIDDFSQYQPRGHYTHSENLKNYFRLFKWFSRIPFFFDDYIGISFLDTNHEEMVDSAIEVTWVLKETEINWFGHNISGFMVLDAFDKFLKAIVGKANSISPQIIENICIELFGENWDINDINSTEIKELVLANNSIPIPEAPFVIDAYSGSLISPKTFVFFGEVLTLDSYALNHLVYPYVASRFLPVGLDFANTCLNSSRSKELLTEQYQQDNDYRDASFSLIDEIANKSGDCKERCEWFSCGNE